MVTLHSIIYSTEALTSNIAKDSDFDVVLIDTAGRMQDNEVCIRPYSEADPVGSQSPIAPYAGPRQARHCE